MSTSDGLSFLNQKRCVTLPAAMEMEPKSKATSRACNAPAAGVRDETRDCQADRDHDGPQGQIPVQGTFRFNACVVCHGTLLTMPFEKICMSCGGEYAGRSLIRWCRGP